MIGAIQLILLGLFIGLIKIIYDKFMRKKIEKTAEVINAVSNHAESKVNNYINKHTNLKKENELNNNLSIEINEDEIYEKIMIEIEEDKKVKSTWARALSQSDGDDKKANSLYINLRVQEIKIELEKLQKQREIELGNQKLIREENERNKIVEIKKVTAVLEDIQDIQNHGYTFISKNILRKDNSWDDLNLIYDEKLDIYYIKKNEQILDSFYIENHSINN